MPELPEVENLVFELKKALEGERIQDVEIRNPSVLETPREWLESQIPGKKIIQIGRRGKFIQIRLSEGLILWFHLGMTGQLVLEEPSVSFQPHTHFVLSLRDSEKRLVYRDVRRFGRISLTPYGEAQYPKGVRRLGPEPREWTREKFASLFKERRARIKSLLLDQRLMAGLGNIYADESLHRAGIHPLRRAREVSRHRLFRLHGAIGEVLDEAIRWGGSSIDDYRHLDGSKGQFQLFHRVYGRTGANCRGCGARIKSVKLSGRSSSFCPRCQK